MLRAECRRAAGSQRLGHKGPGSPPRKHIEGRTETRLEARWDSCSSPSLSPLWTKAGCVLVRGGAPHRGALCTVARGTLGLLSRSPGLDHDLCPLSWWGHSLHPHLLCLRKCQLLQSLSTWLEEFPGLHSQEHPCVHSSTSMHSHLVHRCVGLLPSCPHTRGAQISMHPHL